MVDLSAQNHRVPKPRQPSWDIADRHLTIRHARHRRDVEVYTPVGEIDLLTAPRLRRALSGTEQRLVRRVVIDLSQVTFLGVAGVRVLVTGAAQARATYRQFAVVVTTRRVARVLELTGAASRLATYVCIADAVSAQSRPVDLPDDGTEPRASSGLT
ncbi:MAG: STAS domain-containing protein [Haloechinothrix sp.]